MFSKVVSSNPKTFDYARKKLVFQFPSLFSYDRYKTIQQIRSKDGGKSAKFLRLKIFQGRTHDFKFCKPNKDNHLPIKKNDSDWKNPLDLGDQLASSLS